MENLNDLIWTDETGSENGDADSQGTNMHEICMIAFCGVVRGGSSGGGYDNTAGNVYACIQDSAGRSGACK